MEANKESKHMGLPGANVYWLETAVGVVTDKERRLECENS
jgi:hypothetical protein